MVDPTPIPMALYFKCEQVSQSNERQLSRSGTQAYIHYCVLVNHPLLPSPWPKELVNFYSCSGNKIA